MTKTFVFCYSNKILKNFPKEIPPFVKFASTKEPQAYKSNLRTTLPRQSLFHLSKNDYL